MPDDSAQQLKQQLFAAARQLAQSEGRESFQLRIPNTDPPRYLAVGTRAEIEAFVNDESWQKLGPDDVEEGMLANHPLPDASSPPAH